MMTKQGFIFTLDLVLGTIIILATILLSLFLVSRGSEITISEHQLIRTGSDIVAVLDQQKAFDALDYTTIDTKMQQLLPGNAQMLLRIQGNFSIGNGTIEVGAELPDNQPIMTGQRAALTENNTYLSITYAIWTKPAS